ncbi:hypothetical protein BGZ65_003073, partial [Modicella reniformis]
MAVQQLVLPFQIRNPYRLDRPQYDPAEVWQTVIQEEAYQPVTSKQLQKDAFITRSDTQFVGKGIKRIKNYQRKSVAWDSDLHGHSQLSGVGGVSANSVDILFEQLSFGQGYQQQTSSRSPPKQHPSQVSVPTITVTHHIDTHTELTFERHVEWLTQTALWWDMPVVHLYPAPESATSLKYVETAASRFSSWVNFVKIPA